MVWARAITTKTLVPAAGSQLSPLEAGTVQSALCGVAHLIPTGALAQKV